MTQAPPVGPPPCARVAIPARALVVLCGPSGSGKSTFAAKHFSPDEIVSSDACREMVCGDPSDQSVTPQAFFLAHTVLRLRMGAGKLAVMDSTAVEPFARRQLVAMARLFGAPAVAVVFTVSGEECVARQAGRGTRRVPEEVVLRQARALEESLPRLSREGFHAVFMLGPWEAANAEVARIGR
jgi:protein phosphatase